MSAIFEAVSKFNNLLDVSYKIILGHKQKKYEINLSFAKTHCYHLLGIHYLVDKKDFNLNAQKFFDKVLNKNIPENYFESSNYYDENIIGRVKIVTELESILDSNESVFRYVKYDKRLNAEYFMLDIQNELKRYVFFNRTPNDRKNEVPNYFCDSAFYNQTFDYTHGKKPFVLLFKQKAWKSQNRSELLFKHKNFEITTDLQ